MAATATTPPIAMPAIAPGLRPFETGGWGDAVGAIVVGELFVEVVRVVWDVEFGEEVVTVNVPMAVVMGSRRTVVVYPEYSAQPYPTEP